MVCSLGNGRMAAMARLLAAGSFSHSIAAEEVGHQKLAAQYVQRELREADEANLLDEEDMHVFDLKPMTDPLYLVSCNACKKPIKASQYAAHAELCKSLTTAEEIVSERDGGARHKKPPRKERKKLPTAYDGALITDGSGVSPGNTDYSTGPMPPPTKRTKLLAAQGLPLSHHLETACDAAESLCIGRELPRGSSGRSENSFDHAFGCQKPSQVHDCFLPSKDVPAPLATKMFYSQRNHRLRSALTYLYYEACPNEHSGQLVTLAALQADTMGAQVSFTNNSCEQINDQREKNGKHSLASVQTPDQIPSESSNLYSDKLGGCPQAMSYSNHIPVSNALRPQKEPAGVTRSNYLSKPYFFAGESGTALGTIQQPKGSVPVI